MTLEIAPPERHPEINQAVASLEEADSGQDSVKHSPDAFSILRSKQGSDGAERRDGRWREGMGGAGKEEQQKGHKTWPHPASAPGFAPNP